MKMSNFTGLALLSVQGEPSQVITTGLLPSKSSVRIVLGTLYSCAAGAAVAKPDAKAFSSETVRSLWCLSKD